MFRLFLLGLLGCIVWGCDRSSPSKPDSTTNSRRTIVWINPLVGHPIYNTQDQAFAQAGQDYGVKTVILGPSGIDSEAMVREIENAIVQRVDGIVTVPFNWAVFEDVFGRARAAGIPIVVTGNDTPPDWRLAFIGTDNKAYGLKAAEILAAKTGGKADILVMMSRLDAQNQVEQLEAFKEGIKTYPEMKILGVEADGADMSIAVQKFENSFRARPDIDTVLMLEATGGAAAARVAQEMGISDRLTILAIDDVAETLDEIRNGRIWGTLAQNFKRMGYESLGMIVDHLDGKSVPSTTDSGVILVTKDNIDDYEREMDLAINRRKP